MTAMSPEEVTLPDWPATTVGQTGAVGVLGVPVPYFHPAVAAAVAVSTAAGKPPAVPYEADHTSGSAPPVLAAVTCVTPVSAVKETPIEIPVTNNALKETTKNLLRARARPLAPRGSLKSDSVISRLPFTFDILAKYTILLQW